jgi:arylsulfatase A-like enzyme
VKSCLLVCNDVAGGTLLSNTVIYLRGNFDNYGRYEGGVRVMLMAQHPSLATGVTLNTMVTNLDLAPTILEAAGLLDFGKETLALDGFSWFQDNSTLVLSLLRI